MNILKNKLFLYLTEFFAGMSVMAVELGASRLLAPYFSSSQIVWTIIIGTIMIAMALGNVYTVDVNGTTNRELFASANGDMMNVLQNNTRSLTDPQLKTLMRQVAENNEKYQAGDYIMTDDKAPVELLGMRVIDQIIQEEVAYYKKIYEKEGIQGLLEEL